MSTTPPWFLGFHTAMVRADDVVVAAPCTLPFVTWRPMSLAIETERLTLRLRDERDAAWYRELIGERGEDTPTLEEATARLARFRDLTIETGSVPSRSVVARKAT